MWLDPPSVSSLPAGEIHVWRAGLDVLAVQEQHSHVHSADELERASRFRFPRDRNRYLVGRAVLRSILARYLACAPGDLRFRYGASGKPMLADTFKGETLEFNVSHSGEYALYAVARDRKVGIDIEQMRADMPYEQIAAQFFSPEENRHLRSLPEHLRRTAFYFIWTRKEAYVKARGEGLLLPLDRFDVLTPHPYPATAPFAVHDPASAAPWSVRDVEAFPDYAASLVIEEAFPSLRCWQWTIDSSAF
jgi:4'-phosphopantetheinyl transferase